MASSIVGQDPPLDLSDQDRWNAWRRCKHFVRNHTERRAARVEPCDDNRQRYVRLNSIRETVRTAASQVRDRFPAPWIVFLFLLLLVRGHDPVVAQELTPRAYWPTPQGTKFLILGSSYSTGDIVTDPSLPVVGVESRIVTGVIGYQQTINVAGRTASVDFQVPYVDGSTEGEYRGQPAERNVSGVGDFITTLSVNLMGAPAMTAAEFQEFRYNPNPIIAASLKIVAPTGKYEADRLINVGTNRWASKLKLAYLQPIKEKWVFEMGAGVWFFQDNDEFLGMTREQQPLTALDLSVVRRIKPGFWASIDANYYFGGRTSVDGDRGADFQRSSRLGVSVGYPIKPRHSIKLGFSSGVVTESGGDYNTLILNYIYRLNR